MYNNTLYDESQGQEKSQCEFGVYGKNNLTCHSRIDPKMQGLQRGVKISVFTWVAGAAAGIVAAQSNFISSSFDSRLEVRPTSIPTVLPSGGV